MMDRKDGVMNPLKEARRNAGLTLQQLAEKSELAVETLSRLENGQRKPQVKTLTKIAKALDLPVAELTQGLMGEENREEVLVGVHNAYDGELHGERLNFRGEQIKRIE